MPFTNKSILVVENELLIALDTVRHLESDLGCQHVAYQTSYADALRAIEETRPDVMLLDIDLGEGKSKTGIALAKKVYAQKPIPTIFLTSHKVSEFQKELSGFRFQTYLDKSTLEQNLEAALFQIFATQDNPAPPAPPQQRLFFRGHGRQVGIFPEEFLFAKAEGSYSTVVYEYLGKLQREVTSCNLTHLEAQLQHPHWLRIHKSWAINLSHAREYHGPWVIIKGHEIPIGRKYKPVFLDALGGGQPKPTDV